MGKALIIGAVVIVVIALLVWGLLYLARRDEQDNLAARPYA